MSMLFTWCRVQFNVQVAVGTTEVESRAEVVVRAFVGDVIANDAAVEIQFAVGG